MGEHVASAFSKVLDDASLPTFGPGPKFTCFTVLVHLYCKPKVTSVCKGCWFNPLNSLTLLTLTRMCS